MLSEDDLNLREMTSEELEKAWDLWFDLAQATNDFDPPYTHGVFVPVGAGGRRTPDGVSESEPPATPESEGNGLWQVGYWIRILLAQRRRDRVPPGAQHLQAVFQRPARGFDRASASTARDYASVSPGIPTAGSASISPSRGYRSLPG
jgi:hypothetical protein